MDLNHDFRATQALAGNFTGWDPETLDPLGFSIPGANQATPQDLFVLSLSELNRFTINSVNHPHNNFGRQARRDDNHNITGNYWLRSAGNTTGALVAAVGTGGIRSAGTANTTTLGFRPSL